MYCRENAYNQLLKNSYPVYEDIGFELHNCVLDQVGYWDVI